MTDTPNRFDDLPPKTKEFLLGLQPDEVETLGDDIRLVNSIRTAGSFVKWLIVGILGLAPGTVMFGESVAKILAWFRG